MFLLFFFCFLIRSPFVAPHPVAIPYENDTIFNSFVICESQKSKLCLHQNEKSFFHAMAYKPVSGDLKILLLDLVVIELKKWSTTKQVNTWKSSSENPHLKILIWNIQQMFWAKYLPISLLKFVGLYPACRMMRITYNTISVTIRKIS